MKKKIEVLCAAVRHAYINGAAQPQQHIYLLSSDKTTSHSTWLSKIDSQVAGSVFCLLSSAAAHATEDARPVYVPPPPALNSGSIIQIIFSLLLVLASIVLVAWLLKRLNTSQQSSGNPLKVLGGVSIGQRERVVLVEINDTWLLIGVGPGQIRTLHTLQKTEGREQKTEIPSLHPHPSESKFANLLTSVLNHRKQGAGDK